MNKKKSALLAGIVGAGVLAASASFYKSIQEEKQKAQAVDQVRAFFADFGEIATVFVYEERSSKSLLVGGVVMEDGSVFAFENDRGVIIYAEDDHV